MGCCRDVRGAGLRLGRMSRFKSVPVAEKVDRATFENDIKPLHRPVLLKGLAAHWPVVQAANESPEALGAYLKRFETGKGVTVSVCPPEHDGHFFYTRDLDGFNFYNVERTVSQLVDRLLDPARLSSREALYLQAMFIDTLLPGMVAEIGMPLSPEPRARLWIGNSLYTQTHFDMSSNIACHIAGEKVFTLFPPDQIANMYPGPLLKMPGGVPVSLASLENPDFDAHPRFAQALEVAEEARLEPGDAIYIPAMWWHHVHTVGRLNLLVNYWWNEARADLYPPFAGLFMAALTLKPLPEFERTAWRKLLDYYIFELDGDPNAHMPESVPSFFRKDMPEEHMARLKDMVRKGLA